MWPSGWSFCQLEDVIEEDWSHLRGWEWSVRVSDGVMSVSVSQLMSGEWRVLCLQSSHCLNVWASYCQHTTVPTLPWFGQRWFSNNINLETEVLVMRYNKTCCQCQCTYITSLFSLVYFYIILVYIPASALSDSGVWSHWSPVVSPWASLTAAWDTWRHRLRIKWGEGGAGSGDGVMDVRRVKKCHVSAQR